MDQRRQCQVDTTDPERVLEFLKQKSTRDRAYRAFCQLVEDGCYQSLAQQAEQSLLRMIQTYDEDTYYPESRSPKDWKIPLPLGDMKDRPHALPMGWLRKTNGCRIAIPRLITLMELYYGSKSKYPSIGEVLCDHYDHYIIVVGCGNAIPYRRFQGLWCEPVIEYLFKRWKRGNPEQHKELCARIAFSDAL